MDSFVSLRNLITSCGFFVTVGKISLTSKYVGMKIFYHLSTLKNIFESKNGF